ncbi:GIY-YIG nuclease family protein [Paenibacillus ehimensis]|uniref:GIY-YIG nuclease family protein n=1 Tax=Paenibacillus ehimensis TaxID=79264 RepID=UPI000FD7B390|nr:GIY-YIG nuclease family protein [Paenibacillus ehimensis]
MPVERTNIEFPLWRKKVDSTIFNHKGTIIPNWACSMWMIADQFINCKKKSTKDSQVMIVFENHQYQGNVTISGENIRRTPIYRLWFSDDLLDRLRDVFLMSYMRDIEANLRKVKASIIEEEIPFWEFLDIEYDYVNRRFYFTAHYTQKPIFPELFKRMVDSPVLRSIDDELHCKPDIRIHKQHWKPRAEFETELGAQNVIYTLIDTNNKLLYVGEAKDLVKRFKQGHSRIPEWDFYRYNVLPTELAEHRVLLERMVIRDYASLFTNTKNLETKNVSQFTLVNEKIDK